MSILSIENLSVSFATADGELQALREVSLQVPAGRIVGVVGESGCGKSTLINAVLGLLADNGRIDGGAIVFGGRDLLQLDADAMRDLRGPGIATVFQDPLGALNPVITVGRQMTHIQYRSGLSAADKTQNAVDMLRRVRIPDPAAALHRYPHEFSGGMKQRIAIGMALLMRPSLLIADEPTTALDATLEVATIELLRDLQAQIGCAVLFISHHLGVIAELCSDVVVMYAGEVVESGEARRIFFAPKHPYTRRLLECDPAGHDPGAGRELPTIPGEIPDLRARPAGCIFAPRCHMRAAVCDVAPVESVAGDGHRARCHFAGA